MINYGPADCPSCKAHGDMELLTDPDLLKYVERWPEEIDLKCHICSHRFKQKLIKRVGTGLPTLKSEVNF